MVILRFVAILFACAISVCVLVWRAAKTQTPEVRRVTNTTEEAINLNPSISGDGRIIAFESTEDLAAAGGADHFRAIKANASSDPATFSQMGGTRAVAPAVSQDGSRIAFASKDDPLGTNVDGNSEIFLYEGNRLTQITNTSPGSIGSRTTNGNFQPSISDDGRFIAFSSNRDLVSQNGDGNLEIFIYDSLTSTFTQLTSSSGIVGSADAKISGNGNLVAYLRDNGTSPGPTRDLIEQTRAGGSATVIAAAVPSGSMTYGRAISDDGTRLVYSSQTATNTTQVFLYDGRGAAAIRQITSLGARVTDVPLHPSISGDGTRISFATRRTVNGGNSDGSVELYVYDLPTASISRVTNAPAAATAEVVSALNDDGSLMAFNFARVLSGAVTNSDLANDSEIYLATTQPRPSFGNLAILNGASLGNEPAPVKAVAPDSIAVARGALLANATQQPTPLTNGRFPSNVGGTTVSVNGRPAEIFYVSPGQVNFLVPAQTEIGTADVIVTNSEGFPSRGAIATNRSAPGVFTKSGDGTGEALALNSDTLQQSPFDPSDGKLQLTVFATGARNATQLSVTIGGQTVTPEFVMASPSMPGLDEIHLKAPTILKGAGVVTLSAQADGRDANASTTRFAGGDILINEVLADPPGAAPTDLIGDANHDGVRSSNDDEFVELVNSTSNDLDISGYQLFNRSTGNDVLRHTFAAGTILAARTAVVIFGGGAPNPADPIFGGALVLKASSGGLSLSNASGFVTLRDRAGEIANIFEYGGATGLSGGSNQSLTRSPDISGTFTGHATANGAGGRLFSPGTRLDGTPFLTIPIARIDVSPLSPAIDAGAKQQFSAKAFDAANQEINGVIFLWHSSNAAVATIDRDGLASSVTAGATQITASARGVQSAPNTVTVRPVQRVLTRVAVSPPAVTIPVTGAQQFTAKGLDQFDNEIAGITFTWKSNATAIATIDQGGLARGISTGQATINATTQTVSGSAIVTVAPPTLIVNEVLADPPTGSDGDANHDGTRDGAQDEFVELVNATNAPLNLSGWTLRTHSTTSATETVRHTFAPNTSVSAGDAIVVFGSGNFDPANPLFGCAQVLKASSGGLSLTNSGLTVLLRDASGNLVTEFSYGGSTGLNGGNAQSLTRAPDINGNFVLHSLAAGAAGRKLSAGLKIDGTPFGNCPGHPSSLIVSPSSTSLAAGESLSFTAQAFDQFGRPMLGVPITFASDNTSVATIDSTTPNPSTGIFTASVAAHTPGLAHIAASANDGLTNAGSNQATLNVTGPALSITDVTANEGNTGTTTFTFTVSLSQPAGVGGVKFDIGTFDGTAIGGSDYLARSLSNQVIAAGASIYIFDVSITGDLNIEPNETFSVKVTNVTGASVAKGQGTGTIVNDDSPVLSIDDVSAIEGDSGPKIFTFNVTSTLPAPAAGITFDIATANGTGSAESDYLARTLTNQTIPAGQSTYTFDVTVNGDTLVEPNETFSVNLTNISANASVADGQGLGTIQNDDTPVLVISQIYGGGGNSGATLKNDFIEIYNRGTSTVDLAGWSVQYMSATGGGTWSVTPLCVTGPCVIEAGKYFLVQEDQGGGGTQNLPAPDAIGTIPITTAAGNVALSSSVTALVGACPANSGIQDIVGYGSTAACFEGAGPAAAPANTTADFRKSGGCVDTNDNANDFFVAQPNPRNSASPPGNCKPELTINDVSVTEGNSGSVNATFTVKLEAASSQLITVDFATTDGTATSPADYQPINGTLSFNPGDLTKTITVPVNGDTLDEAVETFFVNLSNGNDVVIIDAQGQGTINDNDPPPALSINDLAVIEGDAATTNATFNVSLSTASGQTVTVNYATADNTATAGTDYRATTGTLTFNPGDLTKTISVEVNGDTIFEPNETFFVNLGPASNASMSDSQAVGTINNDDPAPPVPTFSINDVGIAEGNTGTAVATFTVTLSQAAANVVTVEYATANGTASFAVDYQSTAGSLAFAAGETARTLSVVINGDLLVEPDETFFVNLSNATGGSAIGDSQGTGTIQNDDSPNLVISQIYPGGGLAGATFASDFVELFNRGTTAIDFSVTPYSVQFLSVTASAWVKTDLSTGTILPGRYFLLKETTGANGSPLPTADATGTLNLTSTTAGKVALVSGNTLLSGTCPGDDTLPPFNPANATVADLVGYGGNAATANQCYEGIGRATFTLGNNTIAAYRKAGGCTDTNDNAADTFVSAPSPRNSAAAVNNCAGGAAPALSVSDVSVVEGNGGSVNATFTVSLSAPPQGTDVSFDIATADNSATTANSDYVAKSLTNQIIPAGQTTYTFTVTVNGDLFVEPDETFFVNVSNVSGASLLDGQGTGTIQHDDLPTLSVKDVAANEGDSGTRTFTFQVSLSSPAPGTVTFDIGTADNTATISDNDYVAQTLTGQTIVQGSNSYSFSVTVNGDQNIEPAESFFVNVTNVSGAIVLDGQATGTIQNDDSPVLSIDSVSANEGNNGTTTFTFTVTSTLPAPAGGISFDIATANNTATTANGDYVSNSVNGAVIPHSSTSYTFDVSVNGDTTPEPDETFFVNISNASGGASIAASQGVATITNDDGALLVISQIYPGGGLANATYQNDYLEIFNRSVTPINFATTPYSIQFLGTSGSTWTKTDLSSGSIAAGGYFLVKESGGANGAALPTVDATGSINLTSTTAGKVALVSGTTVLTGSCPTVGTISDMVGYGGTAATVNHCYEGSRPASYALGTNTVAEFRKSGGCLDTNDNAADFVTAAPMPRNSSSAFNVCSTGFRPDITISDVTVTENDSGTVNAIFNVNLSAPNTSQTVTVDYATASGTATAGADFQTATNTLTFAPGVTSQSVTILVNGDTLDEPNETFLVNLSNASNAVILDKQGLGTIADNDPTPSLSINDLSNIAEGNNGNSPVNFTVTLSAASGQTVTVDFATANGTATAGSDYVATSGTLIFNPGDTQQQIPVTINGDTTSETDETFFVNLSNASATATIFDSQGQGVIKNDDVALSSDMSITKTPASTIVIAGNNITYTISVTNNGPDAATNVTMTDTTPANTKFNSLTVPAGWTCIIPAVGGSGTINCSRGSMSASSSNFTLVLMVDAGTAFGTAINNTANTGSDVPDSDSSNNSATATVYAVDPNSADLAVTKNDSPDPVDVGSTLTYSIVLKNNGPQPATNPSFTDNLPAQVNFQSLVPPAGWTCITPAVGGSGSVTCSSLSSLAANATATFPFQVKVNSNVFDGAIISNTVNASTSTTDSVPSNNSATSQTTAKGPQLVISQVYGGGGNTSATYLNDFVEIFNRGSRTIDFSVTPYSIQYAGAASNFGAANTKTDLTTGTIAPGHFFLVQMASSGGVGVSLPTPNATGVINLAATAGKVALVFGTTAIAANGCPGDDGISPFNPNVATIFDFLGYGSTATCYEGSGPPSVSSTNSNARSVIRTAACTDTNVNSADFSNPATAPVARNTATAAVTCP